VYIFVYTHKYMQTRGLLATLKAPTAAVSTTVHETQLARKELAL